MKQRIVIKLGGSSLQNPDTLQELGVAIRGYHKRGYDVVVVHGGGPAINQELTKRGIEWKFINGQRQTTPQMIEVIEEVLARQVNSMVVENLRAGKVEAVGLSGANDILFCTRANEELMQVGVVEHVSISAIEGVLASGRTPVIAPIGFGENNMKFNVNADWAATKIAIALNAKKLVFLTDQTGILNENKELVRVVRPSKINRMIEDGVISGGMCTKVLAMMTAIESGVDQVRVLHASFASRLHGRIKVGTLLTDFKPHAEKDVMHGYAS